MANLSPEQFEAALAILDTKMRNLQIHRQSDSLTIAELQQTIDQQAARINALEVATMRIG